MGLIILIVAAMVAIFSFEINRWLPTSARSFSNLTAQQLHAKITFRTVHYRFPSYIIFKDVKIFSPDGKSPLLQSSRVIMGFDGTIVENLAVDVPALKYYLKQRSAGISVLAKTFPMSKMHILVPNGHIFLKGPAQDSALDFKTTLDFNKAHFSGQGSWGNKGIFHFNFYGDFRNSGLDLDWLTVQEGPSSLNLWGSWHYNSIAWKGFIFYDQFCVLDINGHLTLEDKDIVLKHLSFSMDGDGVEASGHCERVDLSSCDADIFYRRSTQHIRTHGPLKNIHLHFHAQNTSMGHTLKGWADSFFLSSPDSSTSLKSVHLDFTDLKASVVNGNFLKLRIMKLQSISSIQENAYTVPLENFWASIHFARSFKRYITLSARLYTGHVQSRIFLNTASLPWQIQGQGRFEGIDTGHGLLSGNFNLEAFKNVELNGNVVLHNGNFKDSNFQVWMAQTLHMPSLMDIAGVDLSGHFKIDQKSRMLDDLDLKTDDFNLSGFFHMDEDDLISSQASVRFSRKLLNESPIGRQVIGLVHGAWTLPFEFDLSGNVHRINFQWDNSPLKDRVRQHIFSFLERMIDRRMDAHPVYNVTTPSESVSPG